MLLALCGCVQERVRTGADRIRAQPGVVEREFIAEDMPTAMCHASTLCEVDGALIAAWFGGDYEGHHEVAIWSSRKPRAGQWSVPVQVEDGTVAGDRRYACWNPVLFKPAAGPLMLFYKVGPSPRAWWGMVATSADGGTSWGVPRRLPDGILGPIKDKPIQLPDGTLLCPSSTEDAGLRVFSQGWRVYLERSGDLGLTWLRVGPLNRVQELDAIQPCLLELGGSRLQLLARSRSGRIAQAWSQDGGLSWGEMSLSALPNPNSGIDAVTLRDGRQLLVYNHCEAGREVLNVALSSDGLHWQAALVLEDQPGEFSYPAVIQTADGLVHITYSWQRRRVRHVVVDPTLVHLQDMSAGRWPAPGP
jgi:predicted neuraminidase